MSRKKLNASELSMNFLRERQIDWLCKTLDVLTECHDRPSVLPKRAKEVRDIARSMVTLHSKTLVRAQMSMYTRCAQIAGELARNPHAVKSHEALHSGLLPKIIQHISEMAKSLRQNPAT